MPLPVIGLAVRGIGRGIGLASEAIADHKERKQARERVLSAQSSVESEPGEAPALTFSNSLDVPSAPPAEKRRSLSASREKKQPHDEDAWSVSSSDLDNDEAEWALDEAAREVDQPPPSYSEASASSPLSSEEVANAFIHDHKLAPTPSQTFEPLPCPVILPQRRPQDKSRGFVRAYAPLLGSCSGIDQKTFLDFLKDFDKASKASPVFDVINLACFAVGFVPNPIAMGVSIAVQTANNTAKEIQSRYRRNTYLDQINETLFKPRGLYCMIMTFKPDSPYEPVLGINVSGLRASDQALVKATSNTDSEIRQKLKQIRLTSGTARGEMSLPEAAPLIYPALDNAAEQAASAGSSALPEKKKSSLSEHTKFLSSYLDRRAQAKYAGMHPDSKLATGPEKKFASRFSDPNHPANSGNIVALLTGGKFDPAAKAAGRKARLRARRRGYELSEADVRNAEMSRLPRRKQGLIRRVLHKDVLYLTIVNLPGESEMREIMQELDRMKSH